uniref:ARAD1C02574p n=1 Tax=Blastobotrys adeninivorans TaxID=409370 RepID=A0A060T483_BLAAD
MPAFREEYVVVVSPGSETTLVTLGLEESLAPAALEVPTRVYRHATNPKWFSSSGSEENAIYPIKSGAITDVDAFNYLLKIVHKAALNKFGSMVAVPLLLVSSPRWKRRQIEQITQYVFETMKVPGFTIIPNALAAAFAHGLSDALVIDVGKDKTEITPINESAVVEHAQRVIDIGGSDINHHLGKSLPDLTPSQVESLKCSSIFEVLNEYDTKNSWFALNTQPVEQNRGEEDDGVVDVAAIVSSGRTREILEAREREKITGQSKEDEVPNMDREHNTFVDNNNKMIEVGKQRFHGTENLVAKITEAVGDVVKLVDQVNKRQDCWDNVIIVGRGSGVKGFKEALYVALQTRYVILRSTTYSEVPSTFNTGGQNTPNGAGTPFYGNAQIGNQGHGQVPTSIRLAKMAEYFPEWKGHGWEDVAFLGAEIAAKQIFTGSLDNVFVGRSEYNDVGPNAIWDV